MGFVKGKVCGGGVKGSHPHGTFLAAVDWLPVKACACPAKHTHSHEPLIENWKNVKMWNIKNVALQYSTHHAPKNQDRLVRPSIQPTRLTTRFVKIKLLKCFRRTPRECLCPWVCVCVCSSPESLDTWLWFWKTNETLQWNTNTQTFKPLNFWPKFC